MNNTNRYDRQLKLKGFGPEAQQKLAQARVLVVGAGGLGVPVLQYLAGMGVGTIGLVDGDSISLSNLHRQVLYATHEVGLPKVQVAATKLSQLNPDIRLIPYHSPLTRENALEIIAEYDVVVDATDNFTARYLINDACVILKKPFVYGAISEFEGQVSVFNFEDGPTYRCLYPTPPSPQEIPDCNTAGVLGVVPGIIGLQQALETIKLITGIGKSLSGFLQLHDLLHNGQYQVKLKVKPENKLLTGLQASYDFSGCATVPSLQVAELLHWYTEDRNFHLLDVRERVEFEQGHLQQANLIPLGELSSHLNKLPQQVPLVTFCERGARGLKAAQLLLEHNSSATVYNLEGGMQAWLQQAGNKFLAT